MLKLYYFTLNIISLTVVYDEKLFLYYLELKNNQGLNVISILQRIFQSVKDSSVEKILEEDVIEYIKDKEKPPQLSKEIL